MYILEPVKTLVNLKSRATEREWLKPPFCKIMLKTKDTKQELSLKGIYAIYCSANDKVYIGSAMRSLYERLHSHSQSLFKGNHRNIHLQRAYNKYGIDSFEFITIHLYTEIEKLGLYQMEKFYIDWYKVLDRHKGFNIQENPIHPNTTPELRKKLSESAWSKKEKNRLDYNELISIAYSQFKLSSIPNDAKIIQGNKKVFLVDADDYEYLYQFHWFEDKNGKPTKSNRKSIDGNQKQLYMSNIIMNTTDKVYHRNGDKQDCRKSNLMLANDYYKINNKIKFISYAERDKSYKVMVWFDKKNHNVGEFTTLAKAIFYRDCYLKFLCSYDDIIDDSSFPMSIEEIRIHRRK